MFTEYVTVSWRFPEFEKAVAGTGLLVPDPVAGVMLADDIKDQLTEVPLAGTRLKFTAAVLLAEQMTCEEGKAEIVATGLIWTV